MLGCGAHVRKIALPHVRCACGSACGKVFWTVRAKCVRVARFGRAMCDRTFHTFMKKMTRFSVLEHPFCVRMSFKISKKCAKVRLHIARPKSAACTHIAHAVLKTFPHALPHAHRTCGSAIIRTCAPQPNIWLWTVASPYFHVLSISKILREVSMLSYFCNIASNTYEKILSNNGKTFMVIQWHQKRTVCISSPKFWYVHLSKISIAPNSTCQP